MILPLSIIINKSAAKILAALDVPTRKRMNQKIEAVAADPFNPINSKPLKGSLKRSARVGSYRILVEIEEPNLFVDSIGPRGKIYRET